MKFRLLDMFYVTVLAAIVIYLIRDRRVNDIDYKYLDQCAVANHVRQHDAEVEQRDWNSDMHIMVVQLQPLIWDLQVRIKKLENSNEQKSHRAHP